MHYLIYKITNNLNNKIYVGKHKTSDKNDGYLGSGILLGRAVEKYGKENFAKEILFECKSNEEMNEMEASIVDEEFIARDDTYNVKLGGSGGFDYINKSGKNNANKPRECFVNAGKARAKWYWERYENDKEFREEMLQKRKNSITLQNFFKVGNSFAGRQHTDESKSKMRNSAVGKHAGKKNGAFGTCWITNGVENKRVPKATPLETGWKLGRV